MKKGIHPKWYPEARVTCVCGNSFTTGSTLPEINVGICSQCHPFYTGEEKLIDTAGQVERFERRRKGAKGETLSKREKRIKKREEKVRKQEALPKTLEELRKGTKKG